jgi:DHA2 family multidrug resistance protein
LFREINFSLTSIITMMSAIALYGGMYGLSLYLGQIQNYSSIDIGTVMMWVGIPQLFVMPMVPTLMKKVDLRLLTVVGLGLFACSNYLNVNLNSDFGGDQFKISLIIRALGQPLFMIPLSALGMAAISPAQVANASAILNSMRNLGGSIGIALVGTIITVRQASHFSRLVDHLSLFEAGTTERLTMLQNGLMLQGIDATSGKTLALQAVIAQAQKESVIMAFGDVFLLMGLGLVLCLPLIFFMKKTKAGIPGEMH